MVELDIVHTISSDLLDVQYYFQSLIEQAMLCGLLSDSGLAKIQWDLLAILAEQTDKWSRGVLVKLFGNTLFGNYAPYRTSIGVI